MYWRNSPFPWNFLWVGLDFHPVIPWTWHCQDSGTQSLFSSVSDWGHCDSHPSQVPDAWSRGDGWARPPSEAGGCTEPLAARGVPSAWGQRGAQHASVPPEPGSGGPILPQAPSRPSRGGETKARRALLAADAHPGMASVCPGWATGKGLVGARGSSLDPEDFKEQV